MYDLCKNESIMVTCFLWVQKVNFWRQKNVTYDTTSVRNLPILVLSIKTENMQSSKK